MRDLTDNGPFVSNSAQQDRENDGIGDSCDYCPLRFNPDQTDSDADGKGGAGEPRRPPLSPSLTREAVGGSIWDV